MKKCFWLYLLLIIILSFNISNAQWVKVRGGMPWCFTNDSNYLYAGLSGGGYFPGDTTTPHRVIRSPDNGTSWINVSNGLLCDNVFSLTVKGSKLFAGSDNGIYVSSNHGDSWTKLNFSYANGDVHALIVKDSIIFAGTNAGNNCAKGGIYRSTDDGNTWIQVNTGLRNNCCDNIVYAFAKIGNTLYEGSLCGNTCLSTNNGAKWIPIAYTWQVSTLAVIDSTLFAGGWSPSMFRTTDNGWNWTRCESGLTDSNNDGYMVQALVASGKNLFTGTDLHGVLLSTNMGDSWKPINEGLVMSSLNIYSLWEKDKYLIAGTGGGIWRRPISEITAVNMDLFTIPNEFTLGQNYPNPFNPSTTIDYSIPRRSSVTITIFDILGRKVTTLVNSEIDAGNHKVKFDGSSFSSGIYFYQLRIDDYITNKKMILVK